MINRKFFFDHARLTLFDGSLRQSQVNGMNAILDEWDRAYAKKDDRWLAYMLATTHHETAMTMQPIEEYGKGNGRSYGVPDPQTGKAYYGRGFVQLTWKTNYERLALWSRWTWSITPSSPSLSRWRRRSCSRG